LQQIAVQTANSFRAKICLICLSSNGSIVDKLAQGCKNYSVWVNHPDLPEFCHMVTSDGKVPYFSSLDNDEATPVSVTHFLKAQGIQAFVVIPMLMRGFSRGTLSLFFTCPRVFPENELRYLSAVANTAAVALDGGRDQVRLRRTYKHTTIENIVAKSAIMHNVFDTMERVAPTGTNVLIYGESGTGKELIARGIHRLSRRKSMAFVAVDCVAVPSNLLESELFGYEKGAFTGANGMKHGLFEIADHGTFFMDEIGELDPTLQAKLLRVLQERKFRRIGGPNLIGVDIRVISATNRDPEIAVKEGILREDLYYRLNVIPIRVPALRERKEDIPLLATHFMYTFSRLNGLIPKGFSPQTMQALQEYHWPGNIRELQNVIERVIALCRSETIFPDDLPSFITQCRFTACSLPSSVMPDTSKSWKEYQDTFKSMYFKTLMDKTNGNLVEVARLAKVNLRTIYHIINRFKLK
jgi:transcriptional regulator with PAS, ATPase and Fis domain